MPESHLRASDADRTTVADVLGGHMSAGRLTVAEYDDRLARAYAARTYGELAELTADLPAAEPLPAPAAPPQPAPRNSGCAAPGRDPWTGGRSLRAAWASWASTAVIVVGIWAVTSLVSSSWIYPWPMWVLGPWGVVLVAQSLSGRPHDGSHGARSHTAGSHDAWAHGGRGRDRRRDRRPERQRG
jgi:hypothetical protein